MSSAVQEKPAVKAGLASKRLFNSSQQGSEKLNYLVLAAFVVVAAALPFVLPAGEMAIAVRVMIFAIMGIGWNMMSGFGGMFSFGHAAYFGIGAYVTAFLLVDFGVSPWAGMAAGMVVAAAAAVGLSYLAFRYKLQGAYYAMATFAFAEMLRLFVVGNEGLHRTVGLSTHVLPVESFWMFHFSVRSPADYRIAVILVAIALFVSIRFVHSRTGRYSLAVRDDDMAAAALGINVLKQKLITVAISGAVTAAAGTLYFQYYMFIDPDLGFSATVSNNAIITAVVGGAGTIWGPLIGAVLTAPLADVVAGFLRHPPAPFEFLAGHGGLDIILYAIILITVVRLLPKGIVGTIKKRVTKK
jgi:branched-chain amino acid transport system permease protein